MDPRIEAQDKQNVTYRSHRKCKRGHEPIRYTSTGQCVDCVKMMASNKRTNMQAARARHNNLLAQDFQEYTLMMKRKHYVTLEDLRDIFAEDGYRAQCLIDFITMMATSTLTRDDLLSLLTLDERGHVTNYRAYPVRDNDAGITEIQLKGEWYVGTEVMDCLGNKRKSVARVPPPRKLGQGFKQPASLTTPTVNVKPAFTGEDPDY